jgi:hypothetical protein
MLLPWQDPEMALRQLLKVISKGGRGELHFYGGPHPLGDVSGGKFLNLLDELQKHPRVKFHSLVPFDLLSKEYSRYGVAVDVMKRNFERDLASTTRTIIYLWCGLPVIHHNYTELASFIDFYEAGWLVDADKPHEVAECVNHLLDHPEEVRLRGSNARRLIKEHFTWDKTISPLVDFCEKPRFRENKQQFSLEVETTSLQVRRLKRQLKDCQSELATLKGKTVFKLYSHFGSYSFLLIPFAFIFGVLLSLGLATGFALTQILSPFSRKGEK